MNTFVGIPLYFFCDFSLISNVSIDINEYVNQIIYPSNKH